MTDCSVSFANHYQLPTEIWYTIAQYLAQDRHAIVIDGPSEENYRPVIVRERHPLAHVCKMLSAVVQEVQQEANLPHLGDIHGYRSPAGAIVGTSLNAENLKRLTVPGWVSSHVGVIDGYDSDDSDVGDEDLGLHIEYPGYASMKVIISGHYYSKAIRTRICVRDLRSDRCVTLSVRSGNDGELVLIRDGAIVACSCIGDENAQCATLVARFVHGMFPMFHGFQVVDGASIQDSECAATCLQSVEHLAWDDRIIREFLDM